MQISFRIPTTVCLTYLKSCFCEWYAGTFCGTHRPILFDICKKLIFKTCRPCYHCLSRIRKIIRILNLILCLDSLKGRAEFPIPIRVSVNSDGNSNDHVLETSREIELFLFRDAYIQAQFTFLDISNPKIYSNDI